MKIKTAEKRLEKLGMAKQSKAYQILKDVIHGASESGQVYHMLVRPCYTSGSGRFTSNQDHTGEVLRGLKAMNIKYSFGNDAPRGSATGNWIKIKTKFEE